MEEIKTIRYLNEDDTWHGKPCVCPYCDSSFLIDMLVNFCPICGKRVVDDGGLNDDN